MKYLILVLLFSFSAFGNFAKQSEVESNSITKVFTRMKACGDGCIRLPVGYNKSYHVAINEMINDQDSPIYSKNDIEICTDEADCNAKNAIKVCTDGLETAYIAADFSEIYCSRLTGYNQIASGKKIVVEDAGLKSAHMASKQVEIAAKKALKDSIKLLKDKLKSGQDLSAAELREVLKHLIKD